MLGQVLRDIIGATKSGKKVAPAADEVADNTNPLARFFYNHRGPSTIKWEHYFEIYHRHFQKFRNQSPVVLEIGVAKGGSLPMWHDYFGTGTQVVGVDIDPVCQQFENAKTKIMIGDQADRVFLAGLRARVPHVDILIDDGGHTMIQQIATFEELYPHIQPNGIYVCEDTHTSYWQNYEGGHKRQGTYIEYCKGLVDQLNAWHSRDQSTLSVDSFTETTYGMHFYDSMVFIEKRPMGPPRALLTQETGVVEVKIVAGVHL